MITLEKLDIYKFFGGDVDGWARLGSPLQKRVMKDEDWFVIENFIQELTLVKRGLASESFLESLNKRLQEGCDDETTIQEVKKMVR